MGYNSEPEGLNTHYHCLLFMTEEKIDKPAATKTLVSEMFGLLSTVERLAAMALIVASEEQQKLIKPLERNIAEIRKHVGKVYDEIFKK